MFIRIDTDLFVNVNNIFAYKLFDEVDAYKLILWSNEGKVVNTVYYMKQVPTQMQLLKEVVDMFKEFTVNPEKPEMPMMSFNMPEEENQEHTEVAPQKTVSPERRVVETLDVATDGSKQMSMEDVADVWGD